MGYRKQIKYVLEDANITQGKLTIGMRTNVTIDSPLYYAMTIMNNLYGGSVHSKLFLNVREKMSLAYYAGSMYDSYKGLILVSSGIEFKNYDVAINEIFNQLEDIKKANFTDKDIEFSKLAITNAYNSARDSAVAMENFYSSQTLTGRFLTIEEMINNINNVTKDDIIKASKTVVPDTVFFLKGSEN